MGRDVKFWIVGRDVKIFMDRVHIAIVGGGIGGLALALALLRRGEPERILIIPVLTHSSHDSCVLPGFKCTVFEKDPSFQHRRQGFGLTIQQGSAALVALGLGDSVAAASSW